MGTHEVGAPLFAQESPVSLYGRGESLPRLSSLVLSRPRPYGPAAHHPACGRPRTVYTRSSSAYAVADWVIPRCAYVMQVTARESAVERIPRSQNGDAWALFHTDCPGSPRGFACVPSRADCPHSSSPYQAGRSARMRFTGYFVTLCDCKVRARRSVQRWGSSFRLCVGFAQEGLARAFPLATPDQGRRIPW